MSATELRDPFEVVDADAEIALAAIGDDRQTWSLETWLGRGLVLVSLALILFVDLRLVHDTPNYRPTNESNRIAVIEQIAQHGTPPVLGKDAYVIDPAGPLPPRSVALHHLTLGTAAVTPNTTYPQILALERPYPYYLAAASAVVPWNHRVLALRLFSILCTLAGVVFLWAAVREAWPANPLAAGMAALVLGTMSGLVGGFATFDPDSLLLLLWCAGMWLGLRDWRARRCSGWTVAALTAATCVSSVALPAAIAAVLWLCWRAGLHRAVAGRLAVVLTPTVVWVAWNLHAYGNAWPLNAWFTGPARPQHWRSLTQVLRPPYDVSKTLFDGLYASGIAPDRYLDARFPALVALLVAVALGVALLSGRIALSRLALGRFGVLMLGSFASIYLTLFVQSVVAGAPGDYGQGHFGGFAAAWAGVAGIALATPLAGYRRVTIVVNVLVALAFTAEMLRAPIL
jgi:hypothetical protein